MAVKWLLIIHSRPTSNPPRTTKLNTNIETSIFPFKKRPSKPYTRFSASALRLLHQDHAAKKWRAQIWKPPKRILERFLRPCRKWHVRQQLYATPIAFRERAESSAFRNGRRQCGTGRNLGSETPAGKVDVDGLDELSCSVLLTLNGSLSQR